MSSFERTDRTLLARAPLQEYASRHLWWVLSSWSALWLVVRALVGQSRAFGYGWHFFVTGSRAMLSGNGAHLYASHPELQVGPLTFLVTAPFTILFGGAVGKGAAALLMSAAGLGLLHQLRLLSAHRADRNADSRFLLTGLLLVPVWSELAVVWMHPDDVLALALAVIALRFLRADRAIIAAVLLGLSADCKPWALAFAAMLLLHPRWARPAIAYCLVVTAAWAPFILIDPHTLSSAHYKIANSAASVIRLFGVHNSGTPAWCRPGQILLGLILGGIAARRNRWAAVMLIAISARLLLEPGTKNYYDAGLVAAAALYDLVLLAGAVPWLTVTAVGLFWIPSYLLAGEPQPRAVLRALVLLGFLAIGVAGDRIGFRTPGTSDPDCPPRTLETLAPALLSDPDR